MTVETLPDVEGALRTFLRAQSTVTAICGQRVFFGVPKSAPETSFPLVTIQRVGGGAMGIVPVDDALVQIDAWGRFDTSGHGKKAEALSLVNAVLSALRAVEGRTALNADVDAFGVSVESVAWAPDPDNDRPRYSVTAEVTAISS